MSAKQINLRAVIDSVERAQLVFVYSFVILRVAVNASPVIVRRVS